MIVTLQCRLGILLLWFILGLWPGAVAWSIRPAAPSHVSVARQILLSEWMNPLSISQEHLWVAVQDDQLLGFGQIRPLGGSSSYQELASLYVVPSERRKGIATQLITNLLAQEKNASTTICLLTLRPTVPLYEPHGFAVLDLTDLPELPWMLQIEFTLGTLISQFLGNELVCMIRTSST